MFYLMAVVFVLGYIAIALEHPLRIDKTASALLTGTIAWVIYILGSSDILNMKASFNVNGNEIIRYVSNSWNEFVSQNPTLNTQIGMRNFITNHELLNHLGNISEIVFFLLGAMTIVEIVDQHQGFKVITHRIKTTKKVKLLWILGILTFFLSSILDNLTTTIVIVALIRKLINDPKTRWFYAGITIIAANAGGAWTPIGDVTTIMLWIGGQITTVNIMKMLFFASMISLLIPLIILTFTLKGNVERPDSDNKEEHTVSNRQQFVVLCIGVGALLFVPIFKSFTHLPPYIGMLLGLGILWLFTEIVHKWYEPKKQIHLDSDFKAEITTHLTVIKILSRVDVPTILFFLGILLAVASLESAGQLGLLAQSLDKHLGSIYLIDIAIGLLSAVIDNVPLVAGSMGMYEIQSPEMISAITNPEAQVYAKHFMVDGTFWEFLAYCAGTGGSILIIGSAAGVAAMGMEKIDFIWYLKKISLLALLGYFAGAGAYYLQMKLTGHI
jgi:Na+/H+ antiporter NhaD/arsenite permease-like protein